MLKRKKIKIIILLKSNTYRTESKSDIFLDFILYKLTIIIYFMKSAFELFLEYEYFNYNVETERIVDMENLNVWKKLYIIA